MVDLLVRVGNLVIADANKICWIVTVNDNFLMETCPEVKRVSMFDMRATCPEASRSFFSLRVGLYIGLSYSCHVTLSYGDS